MKKNTAYWVFLLVMPLMGFCCGRYSQLLKLPFQPHKTQDFLEAPGEKRAEITAIEGALLGLGLAPFQKIEGVGHFTFKPLPNIQWNIPRVYLSFEPNRPDGVMKLRETLLLLFYLPNMQSHTEMAEKVGAKVMHPEAIHVSITAKDDYIRCRGGILFRA
jgi:hypothetical protein